MYIDVMRYLCWAKFYCLIQLQQIICELYGV